MPIRIRVDLEPADPAGPPPRDSGHAVNAAVLAAVREHVSPRTADGLHSPPGYKPYTVTPLLDDQYRAPASHGGPAWFEVSVLDDRLGSAALTALENTPVFRIGRTFYENMKVGVRMASTYTQLAARPASDTTWEFMIVTPSGFATATGEGPRREIPWPDPARVFTNLARRWAYFAPDTPLPDGLDSVIVTHIEVEAFDLHSARYLVKPGERLRNGAVGSIKYRLAGARKVPSKLITAIDALAKYAEYAGFGDRTAMGMGHVRAFPYRCRASSSGPHPANAE